MSAKKTSKTKSGAKAAKPKGGKALKFEPLAKPSVVVREKEKLSAIDAAAKVLGEAREPMGCKEMIEAMATKGYWKSPGGKTPHATLYSAILREINMGKGARFKKTERGKFVLSTAGS